MIGGICILLRLPLKIRFRFTFFPLPSGEGWGGASFSRSTLSAAAQTDRSVSGVGMRLHLITGILAGSTCIHKRNEVQPRSNQRSVFPRSILSAAAQTDRSLFPFRPCFHFSTFFNFSFSKKTIIFSIKFIILNFRTPDMPPSNQAIPSP